MSTKLTTSIPAAAPVAPVAPIIVPPNFITSNLPGIIADPIQHYFSRRSTGVFSIQGICLHETGAHGDPQAWFNNLTAEASATYCVMQTGTIKQYLTEDLAAWACGVEASLLTPQAIAARCGKTKDGVLHRVGWPYLRPYTNPNDYLLSIENEKTDADAWAPAQLDSLTSLMADIAHRYNFPIDNAHVVRHHDIWDGHICPGTGCPWDQILGMASAKLAKLVAAPAVASPVRVD